jgi:hypothetical protein
MSARVRIDLPECGEHRARSRLAGAAAAVARREHVRNLEAVALSVGLGSVLWLLLAPLARFVE